MPQKRNKLKLRGPRGVFLLLFSGLALGQDLLAMRRQL